MVFIFFSALFHTLQTFYMHIYIRKSKADFFFQDFILFIWERESESKGWGEGQEAEVEREKQTPCWAESLSWDWSQDPNIVTWARGRRLTDWATQVPCNTDTFNILGPLRKVLSLDLLGDLPNGNYKPNVYFSLSSTSL